MAFSASFFRVEYDCFMLIHWTVRSINDERSYLKGKYFDTSDNMHKTFYH